MKSFNLSLWAVQHRSLVLFLIISSLIGGIVSFNKLGRSEDPKFDMPAISITVAWPGATAEQLQNQVINPIEAKLQEIDGFNYTRTFSRQGYGGIFLMMQGGMSSAQLHEAWYQARKKIGDIRSSLPAGVMEPMINDEYSDVYTALFAIQSNDLSPAEVLDNAQLIKRQLQHIPDIKKVDILGQQEEKIYVEFSSKRLAALGINPQAIYSALQQQNNINPAGMTDTHSDRVFVRVDGAYHTVADVANTSINASGHLLKLSDIATVKSGYLDPANYTVRYQGRPALTIGVTMQPAANIITFGHNLDLAIATIKQQMPLGLDITKYDDQPKIVADSVWEFERSFIEALVIVLIVSFLSLGFRSGLVVAASVPLVLALVAIVMYFKGWNLDRISLGSLIIALGLLVDDAIIAVELMSIKMAQGWDKVKSATFAYTSTAFPMLTGTLITVAGFMPVGFAHSNAGQYAGSIFWILGAALCASWLVAVIFTPYLGVVFLSDQPTKAHDPYDRPLFKRLRNLIAYCVKYKWWVIGGSLVCFVIAIAGMSLVQNQFFPAASRNELVVELRMRQGASFVATQNEVIKLEKVLANNRDVTHVASYTGGGAARFFLSLMPEFPNASFAQIVVLTPDVAARERVRSQLLKIFNDNIQFPLARGRVQRLEFGPPVGFPVQFRVIGSDPEKVRGIADQVLATVKQSPLVKDTQLEWGEKVRTVHIHVDQDKARLLGVSSHDIANTTQTLLDGLPVTQIPNGETQIDIVMRALPQERGAIGDLADVLLPSSSGALVPLSQVATVSYNEEDPVLWRRSREINLSVMSDLADGVQAPYASDKIMQTLKPIIRHLPAGYRIEEGGAVEENDTANAAIVKVLPVMLLATLLLLMMQLQSFAKTAMVFLTAPLGMIGVVPALLVFNAPFGFVALIGVIALSGMVMRNSVILVDQIDHDIAAGQAPAQAIVEATIRRSRPVVLTALTAFLAMIPLSHSAFWGPMAIVIMGGLLAGTFLTIMVVPALYAAWFKVVIHADK